MSELGSDVFRWVAERGACGALVAVVAAEVQSYGDDGGDEYGQVALEVREVFAGAVPLAPPGVIRVGFERRVDPQRRLRARANRWNALPFAPGAWWLLSCRPVPGADGFRALAAQAVRDPSAPEVGALRACYALERAVSQGGRAAREAHAAALCNPDERVRRYAERVPLAGAVGRPGG